VMRLTGGLSSRRTAIASPAPTRYRMESRSASHHARRPPKPGERDGDASCCQTRPIPVVAPWLALAISLMLTSLVGCGQNARAQTATPPPQPTADKTVDAVVRGFVTIVVPTATRPPAPTTAPQRVAPVRPTQTATSAPVAATRALASPSVTSTALDARTATPGVAQAEPTLQPRRPPIEEGRLAGTVAATVTPAATRITPPAAALSATAGPAVAPATARPGPAGSSTGR